jgi:hypothetical protein
VKPWKQARPEVQVKLLAQKRELYVFAERRNRIDKERGMRGRQMKWDSALWCSMSRSGQAQGGVLVGDLGCR